MIKLSVVIITFNEERNIERCILSVKDLADEIVVVDSYSADATPAICQKHGVVFIQHPFEGHIEQKNYALSKAAHEYVLSLDADEALSPALVTSIRKLKNDPQHACYVMNRLTNYCGQWIRHGGWYPDKKMRLFRKDSGSWGGQNPHDRFVPNAGTTSGFLDGDLFHYSYYSVDGHLEQVNKFTSIGAKSAFESGSRSSIPMLLLKPVFKFIRDYIFLLGFLDGYYGFVISRISAHATFIKYVKLRELERQQKKS